MKSKDGVLRKKVQPKWDTDPPYGRHRFSEHVFKLGCKNVYLSGLYENPICNQEGGGWVGGLGGWGRSNRASDKNK